MTGLSSMIPDLAAISDPDDIGQIAELLTEAGVDSLELSDQNGSRLFIRLAQPENDDDPLQSSIPQGSGVEYGTISVKTPYFGNLCLTHPLRDEPFVTVGSKIRRQDVVCLVTLDTLQIPVLAPVDGEVVTIMAQEGERVGFGREIMHIRSLSR